MFLCVSRTFLVNICLTKNRFCMVKTRPEWLIKRKTRFFQFALEIFTMNIVLFLEQIFTRNVLLQHMFTGKMENLIYMSFLGRKRPLKMAYFHFSGRVFTLKNLFFLEHLSTRNMQGIEMYHLPP
jgi:hypothetical protein